MRNLIKTLEKRDIIDNILRVIAKIIQVVAILSSLAVVLLIYGWIKEMIYKYYYG